MAKGFLYDNGDELITREDVSEVPSGSSANIGDVLSLDSNKKPKWSTPESGLPSTGSASVGDVLTLDEDKDPVWSAPSVGGGPLVVKATGTATVDTSDQDEIVFTIPCDKTLQEIAQAIDPDNFKGLVILFPYTDSGISPYYSYNIGIRIALSEIEVFFSGMLNIFCCEVQRTLPTGKYDFLLNDDGDEYNFEIHVPKEH